MACVRAVGGEGEGATYSLGSHRMRLHYSGGERVGGATTREPDLPRIDVRPHNGVFVFGE